MNKAKKKIYDREYYLKNKEKKKIYAENNKERILKYYKEYYLKNKEYFKQYKLKNKYYIKEYREQYRLKNKEKILEYSLKNKEYFKQLRLKNIEHYREYNKKYRFNRRKTDLHFKLSCCLRSQISRAIRYSCIRKGVKGSYKSNSTINLLGCSIDDFKKHLQSLFEPWMSWKNYGKWHIDHIKPCALFDLTLPKQQQECFHWSNMRPLEAIENIKKGKKYEQTKS